MGVKAVLPICVPSFGKKCDLNSTVYLYFIQNSRLHGIKLVRLPNSSRKKLRSLLFTKPVCPAELVLINSDIPKFILHIQWLLWKAGSEITKAQTVPLSRMQAIHSFPWFAPVTDQTCRRETGELLTVSPTKRYHSFVLAVSCTILRKQLCMAESSVITQNLSHLGVRGTLGYNFLDGDEADRRPHSERTVKIPTHKILYE